jgi:hypothetical protein
MAATTPENRTTREGTQARDVDGGPPTGPDAAARTVLDGPALENEEMRRGTEDLQSSEAKIDQARELAHEVARRTEPAEQRPES